VLDESGKLMTTNARGPPTDSVADYGRTTMENVVAWETTFGNTPSRNNRNSTLLYALIINSLSAQGFQRVEV
jgi:hypothetical protein